MILDQIAMLIGYSVMIAGGVGLTAVVIYFPFNYAWKKYGDLRALVDVCKEARRQGRSIYGDRK